jgi:transposase InsO family protein
VVDITYVRTGEGWLYLAAAVDAFSRRVVGWAMADHLRTELVLEALELALWQRRPAAGLIHHTDRGCQPGFKGSSQHGLPDVRLGDRSGLRPESSSRAPCAAGR